MPIPQITPSWAGSLWWLVGLTAAALLVSWLPGNRMHWSRDRYIGVLTVVTAGLAVGYVAWLDIGVGDVLTSRWGWGLVGGVVVGAVTAVAISKMPATLTRTGADARRAFAWEGLVYGIAEGLLLSALPAYMVWQMVHSLGWIGVGGGLARWALPLLASAAVIVVHHLGYWEYRNRTLIPITVGCSLLTLAFLLSGSVIAPVLGHALMHAGAIRHGTELPPHRWHPDTTSAAGVQKGTLVHT